jgi:demethylmenaquinone methyltransferase / 2-methoxy-6-polyprenyl-1,4-benzoquinol methylase
MKEGMEILDVGCGTGVLEDYLARTRLRIIGVDLTEEMIRIAQRKKIGCMKSLTVGDAELLPFRDASFDVVLSCYVVKYCRPELFATEVMRVLRPGGRVLLYDFSRPRGIFAPFHAFYVYGLLRIFGQMLDRIDPQTAFTYQALPTVIQERKWDDSFGGVLRECGFSEIGDRRLSGGVVTAFWGKKE